MTMLPTPEELRVILSMKETLATGASYLRCPDGASHAWNYSEDSQGSGWYECQRCPTVVTKATLKRATDHRTG